MKEIRSLRSVSFPDCAGVMRGASDEEAMAAAAEHGRGVHGMTDADFTDENVAIIRSHIKDVWASPRRASWHNPTSGTCGAKAAG
jgi:predicted small metal-binding protein